MYRYKSAVYLKKKIAFCKFNQPEITNATNLLKKIKWQFKKKKKPG